MSNSTLVSYTKISPNRNSPRNHSIDRITIHCVVGQASVVSLGELFANPGRQASSNYGVGFDGRIGMYCPESDRSWCSSSAENDNRAITIEVASDNYAPYAVNSAAYASLINLCVDICKRNGKTKLLWLGSKSAALSYSPKSNEMVMTAHRWFADTICPGDYLYTRFGEIAKAVTSKLEDSYIWAQKWHLYDSKGTMQTGWKKVKGKWYFLDSNGIMKTGWLRLSNKWYLLSGNGDMLSGWQKVNGKWYLLAGPEDGHMLTGWQKVNNKWYYLDPVNGDMKTGWLKDKNKWYYLNADGSMVTGTKVIDGKTYHFDSSGALIS